MGRRPPNGPPNRSLSAEPTHADVVIVGSGFAGLGLAIKLKQAGLTDFIVLERGDDVGGTWRDNTYPGAACDVPSLLYSFSFAPNPSWSRSFSPQPEIQTYLRRCAADFGVRPFVRFGCELLEAHWDEPTARWTLQTSQGEVTARVLVSAGGGLSDPATPDLKGLAGFTGTVFHSAGWNHDHDLTGERVAVIGTGASAIQFVPQIRRSAGQVHLFQRTPPWILPRTDRAFTRLEKALYRHLPALQRLARAGIYWGRETYVLGFTGNPRIMRVPERIARWHLRRQVPDPALRAALTPSYTAGCKRILISNDYYPALSKPNVEVVTEAISEIRPTSIVTADGAEREVDTIIFGTGFHTTELPVADRIHGARGFSLAEAWRDGVVAYLGSSVAGFPNLFLLVGPNTGLGHTSQVLMIESQIGYVMSALRTMAAEGAHTVDVRKDVQDAYNDEIQHAMEGSVWTTGHCASWYLDASGKNRTLWPGSTWRFRLRTRTFDPAAYHVNKDNDPSLDNEEQKRLSPSTAQGGT